MTLLIAYMVFFGTFMCGNEMQVASFDLPKEYVAMQGEWEASVPGGKLCVTVRGKQMSIKKNGQVIVDGEFVTNGTYIGFTGLDCKSIRNPSEFNRLFNTAPLMFENGTFVWNGNKFRKVK
ncbi:MAG: hypothetical protein IK025_08095 [Bacteroidales bacterium]|nr:hypothetical protein [Bacteroidales bacterium]